MCGQVNLSIGAHRDHWHWITDEFTDDCMLPYLVLHLNSGLLRENSTYS